MRILATSAASGVVSAVRTAAVCTGRSIDLITASADARDVACGSRALPYTSDPSFGQALLDLIADVRPQLVVAGRDEDAAAMGSHETEIRELGASLTTTGHSALAAAHDKALTAAVLQPVLRRRGASRVRMARTALSVREGLALVRDEGSVIIKPRFGNASRGVRWASDETSLAHDFDPQCDVVQEHLASSVVDSRPWDTCQLGSRWGERSYQLAIARNGQLLGAWASVNVLFEGRPIFVDRIDGPLVRQHVDELHRALTDVGARGIWNAQAKLVGETAVVFELNGRFTGITGVRAADGFDEIALAMSAYAVDSRPAQGAEAHHSTGTFDCRQGYPGTPIDRLTWDH